MRVLITSGATIEPIDGVRHITNFSSGKTGATIANYFIKQKSEVYFIHGVNSALPDDGSVNLSYNTFNDLDKTLMKVLSEVSVDLIIHLAAISDFSIDYLIVDSKKVYPKTDLKISSKSSVSIQLKQNHKIIKNLCSYSRNTSVQIIGFKLTNSTDEAINKEAVQKIFNNDKVSYVVHNDMNEITEKSKRTFYLFEKNGFLNKCEGRLELAELLYKKTKGER